MNTHDIPAIILNDLNHAVICADTGHIVRYMNAAARKKYAKYGDLMGKSLMDCHNEKSRRILEEYVVQMKSGADGFIEADKGTHKVYVRSVRNASGDLLGYYEIE
jgi:DUF438 domain-containing protein